MDTLSRRLTAVRSRNSLYDPNQLEHKHEENIRIRKKHSFLVFGNGLLRWTYKVLVCTFNLDLALHRFVWYNFGAQNPLGIITGFLNVLFMVVFLQ